MSERDRQHHRGEHERARGEAAETSSARFAARVSARDPEALVEDERARADERERDPLERRLGEAHVVDDAPPAGAQREERVDAGAPRAGPPWRPPPPARARRRATSASGARRARGGRRPRPASAARRRREPDDLPEPVRLALDRARQVAGARARAEEAARASARPTTAGMSARAAMTPKAPPAAARTSDRWSIQPGRTRSSDDVGEGERDGRDAERAQEPAPVGAVAHRRVEVVEVAEVERAREEERREGRPDDRRRQRRPRRAARCAATGPRDAPARSATTSTVSSAKK